MNIYVAGKFEAKEEVRRVQNLLIDGGHTISSDWTQESTEGLEGEALQAYLAECAVKAVNGVLECDVMVLLTHELGKGMYTELGLAIAYGRVVYVVGRTRNIFYNLPQDYGIKIFGTVEAAISALEDDCFV